jgi:hypothetical protein
MKTISNKYHYLFKLNLKHIYTKINRILEILKNANIILGNGCTQLDRFNNYLALELKYKDENEAEEGYKMPKLEENFINNIKRNIRMEKGLLSQFETKQKEFLKKMEEYETIMSTFEQTTKNLDIIPDCESENMPPQCNKGGKSKKRGSKSKNRKSRKSRKNSY